MMLITSACFYTTATLLRKLHNTLCRQTEKQETELMIFLLKLVMLMETKRKEGKQRICVIILPW